MKYNKVIIKLSGEALSGNNTHGIDKEVIYEICNKIKNLREKNVQVAVVVGGGNFWRGRSNQYLDNITTNNMTNESLYSLSKKEIIIAQSNI